jgi:transmembrane sensor
LKKSVINVVVNFLNDQSNVDELEFLLEWIKDSDNYKLFTQYISIHHFSNWAMNKADQEKIIKEINHRINTEKTRKDRNFSFKNILKYAAIITISIAVGYYNQFQNTEKEINNVVLDPNKVTLNTSNGNQIILNDLDDKIIKTDEQILIKKESRKIVFDKQKTTKKILYNTLTVPYGERFDVELSDGSIVRLNSGSSLKFPVQFIDGMERKVYLDGEAFFNISENKKDIFKVLSNNAVTEVYGTQFNIKSYREDSFSEIILVDGSLGVKGLLDHEEIVSLKPGYRAKVNQSNEKIEIKKVNTKIYTSWIDGRIIFRDENIDSMILKLERLYNVIITNNNKKLSDKFFNATIVVDEESIDDVMGYLKEVYNINYQKFNNKIVIK